jgi:glucosamine--fructose-6-phosphate aminotransferase (isomerizing)
MQKASANLMWQEMQAQPAAVQALLVALCPDADGDVLLEGGLRAALAQGSGILWAACGSSLQAAHLGAYALAQLAAVPCARYPAHELISLGRAPWRTTQLAILVSQSGETEDTLEAMRLAQTHAVPTLCVVNAPDSAMARLGRWRLDTHAGEERAVPSTKGFLNQAVTALLLACATARAHRAPRAPIQAVLHALHALPATIGAVLGELPSLTDAAAAAAAGRQVIYLGRGADWPIACEGALKLMESAYLPAQGFAMGEFKHGPMAGLDGHTPVIAAVSPGPLVARTRQNLDAIRACGAPVWWIGPHDLPEMATFDGSHIPTPSTDPLVAPLLAAVVMQRLAYAVAQHRDIDPSRPRHLVKSVQEV